MTLLGYDTCALARNARRTATLAPFVLGVLCLCGTTAKASSLLAAAPYNAFVFNGFTETGSDDGGRLAVGGNATFNNAFYTVMQSPLDGATAPDSLVVGGKVLGGPVNVQNGSAFVGDLAGSGIVHVPSGQTVSTGTDPVDFAGTKTALLDYSNFLSLQASNGTVTDNGFGTTTLTGTSSTLNIFTVDASLIGPSKTVIINDPAGSTVLINVIGTNVTTTGFGIKVDGTGANGNSTTAEVSNLIFNFSQATSLTLGGSFLGTILAPSAAVIGGFGQIDGQLIANSFSGPTEFHDFLFTGQNLPLTSGSNNQGAVPEPASFAMLGAGLIAFSFIHRKWFKR
jgi:choice-of-anchor A domain-containing protein